jgi:ATP-dependent helicase Lhr and Lhr-like helicase
MLADGYSTRRGRRGAYLHSRPVNACCAPRRGARLARSPTAAPSRTSSTTTCAAARGAPRRHAERGLRLREPAGDIFQLGNTSYRILKVETGKVLVEDAQGQPPNMPFWLGEAPGRSDELSRGGVAAARGGRGAARRGRTTREAGCARDAAAPAAAAQQLAGGVPRRGAGRARRAADPRHASCSSASSTRSATCTW